MSMVIFIAVAVLSLLSGVTVSIVNSIAIAVPFHQLSLMRKQLLADQMKLGLQVRPLLVRFSPS